MLFAGRGGRGCLARATHGMVLVFRSNVRAQSAAFLGGNVARVSPGVCSPLSRYLMRVVLQFENPPSRRCLTIPTTSSGSLPPPVCCPLFSSTGSFSCWIRICLR